MEKITDLIRISVSKILLPAFFTAVLLVISVGAGSKPAQAQTAAQTVSDLLGSVSIPGLDALPVSNLQSADVTVHGQTATIVIFKPSGADKNVIAVVPNNFSLSNFVPLPSGTPLDDVTFSDMAFIIAQANISLDKDDAPKPLNTALSHGGDTVTLKQGVNLFGEADFSASSTVKDLLSNVGITDLTLPLNGGLPANLFSQNPKTAAADFKNQILDNLDINLPMPKINVPGISNIANIRRTALSIKGQNKGGTRSVDIKVVGELDVQAGGKSVAFDFDVEIQKQGQFKIVGRSAPGSTVTVPMVETVKLSDIKLIVLKWGGGWSWWLQGQSRFRSKNLMITLVNYPSNQKTLMFGAGGMSLGEFAGYPDLPVLGDIIVGEVSISPKSIQFGTWIKGVPTNMLLYKPDGGSKYHAGFVMGDFSPDKLIPGTSNTPLKDAAFKKLVFVYNPTNAVENTTVSDLPGIIAGSMPPEPGNVAIKPGLNVFGHLDIHPSGEMATLLKEVGVTDLSLPLNGTFSPQALANNHDSVAIKNAILA